MIALGGVKLEDEYGVSHVAIVLQHVPGVRVSFRKSRFEGHEHGPVVLLNSVSFRDAHANPDIKFRVSEKYTCVHTVLSDIEK